MLNYETINVDIETGFLKAATMFAASNKDDRYYLKGIYIEPSAKGLTIIATNGHIMFVAKHEMEIAKDFAPFIIPIEIVKKALIGHKYHTINIQAGADYENLSFHKINYIEFSPIGAKYPNWRRVVPEITSGENANFCPNYIGIIGKAIKAVNGRPNACHIWQNGDKAALVSIAARRDCFAVIMPKLVHIDFESDELVKNVLHPHDMLQAIAAE
jgi:DNA polymerase III subunit beta